MKIVVLAGGNSTERGFHCIGTGNLQSLEREKSPCHYD